MPDQPPERKPVVRAREEQLALLVESVRDYAIFMLDPSGVVASWNPGAQRLKGYTADEIIGQHFSRFYTEPDRARDHPAEELEIAEREGRFEEEGWRVRKDGSQFWANVVITALRGPDGELVGFGKVTRDLTARRLNEEQLRARAAELELANSELRQFRMLVANVQDYAIFMLDAGGHVATWNLGAERLKGYTTEEALGRHFAEFYTPEDRERGLPAHALREAASAGRYEAEGWRCRKDGSRFWASATLTALRNESGMLVGYAKVTRDLTERKRAADELQAAHARLERTNRELEHLAAAAAHDLRDPLVTIKGFATMLEERYGDALDETGRHFVARILGSTAHMKRLIHELSQYAHAGEAFAPDVPVSAAGAAGTALESCELLLDERGAEVSLDVPPEALVAVDQLAVERVFQNLITNAIKFAGDPARIEVSARRAGNRWRFGVTDNGPGVPPGEREVIFEPFRRAKGEARSGTGLGLAICRKTVENYGGSIGVEAAPSGRGSRFWFTLPAAD